jgi:Domain of unknown function (DUF4411)
MPYLLDSNTFIQAKNQFYAFDVCPAYWDWLLKANQKKLVFSVSKVQEELVKGHDELAKWAQNLSADFFMQPDKASLAALAQVSAWVTNQNFEQAAITEFLQRADLFLIGKALAGQFTVVTYEVQANTAKKVKIPNVCAGLNIKCINAFAMLSLEKARFILET